jgi:hypothetical protein
MKKLNLLSILVLFAGITFSQVNIQTALNVGGADDQWGKKIVTDNSSAALLLIEYSNSITLGSQTYVEASGNGTAIARYTGTTLNWSANILAEETNDICTDLENNIYVVGYGSTDSVIYQGPADTVSFRNAYQGIYWDGPYIMKLDSNGHFIYGHYFNHGSGAFTNVSKARAVKADQNNHVYIAGELQFFFFYPGGDSTRINGPSDKLFIAQFDGATGAANWAGFAADLGAGTGRGHIDDIAVLYDQYVFITGDFMNTMTFTDFTTDSVDITSTNNMHEDIFIAGFDSSGQILGAKGYGGIIKEFAKSIAASDTDHIYISGWFDSPGLVLDNATIPSAGLAGEFDGFIIRLNYDADAKTWIDEFGVDIGTDGITHVNGLDVDADGNVYATGDFDQTLEFGLDMLSPDGNGRDVFFIILDELGNKIVWQKSGNAPGSSVIPLEHDEGYDIVSTWIYSACITGRMSTTDGQFGNVSLSTAGDEDAFLGKIDQSVGIKPIKELTDLHLFPNPAVNNLVLELNSKVYSSAQFNIVITDFQGRKVYSEMHQPHSVYINVKDYENGLYFISVFESGVIRSTGKFIKHE